MKKILATLVVIAIIFSCKKKDSGPPPSAPVVTTAALTNVTISSGTATAGGSIVTDGGAAITKSGIVWSKTNNTPTLTTDSIVAGTTATGTFTNNITGLDFGNTYYFRAFATNSVGTGYGNVVTLTTSADSVKFAYNGQSVTYGIITSPTTGKKWLDRNLGAKRQAATFDDYQAYGDLFQWGRPADGHQLINWTNSTTGTAVNGTTNVLATTDIPGHSNFIVAPASSAPLRDWRNDNNRNRWATVPQGPCPAGWHVPTLTEWKAETATSQGGTATSGGITNRNTAYNLLKITVAGLRSGFDGSFGTGANGPYASDRAYYWGSTDQIQLDPYSVGDQVAFFTNNTQFDVFTKRDALSVRCIKD